MWDDDDRAEFLKRLDEEAARYQARAFAEIVSGYQPSSDAAVPLPLEWHPAYRDKSWLVDWLSDDSHPHGNTIRLPLPRGLSLYAVESDLTAPVSTMSTTTMRKRRCVGLAPYVGEPYVYVWNVGVDEAGRMISSDSYRQPTT